MKVFLRKIQAAAISGMWMLWIVQIILGIVWLIGNVGRVPDFQITGELLDISKSMVTDEYIGIAYPFLIRMARLVEKISPLPYYIPLYVLQLGVGFGTLYKVLDGRRHRVLLALGVMTIPVVSQFFAAVTPEALASSMLLLCIYYHWEEDWVKGGFFWLLGGLLIPEYFLFGGLVFLVEWAHCLLVRGGQRKASAIKGLAVLLTVCLLAGIVWSLTVEEGSRGRMNRGVAAMALHRFVWPNFAASLDFWQPEARDLFDLEEMTEFSRIPETVLTKFGPVVERTYGIRKAHNIYWDMAKSMLRVRTTEIATDMAGDLLQYSVPLAALLFNRLGIGVTYDSWNYGLMSERMPRWTNYFVSFAGLAFMTVLLLGGLSLLLSRKKAFLGKRAGDADPGDSGKSCISLLIRLALVSALLVVWYTMSVSGMQDYRHVVFVSLSWGIGMVFLTESPKGIGDDECWIK